MLAILGTDIASAPATRDRLTTAFAVQNDLSRASRKQASSLRGPSLALRVDARYRADAASGDQPRRLGYSARLGAPAKWPIAKSHWRAGGRAPRGQPPGDTGRSGKRRGAPTQIRQWLWADADRAERLARFYNKHFDAVRPRAYDGSHLSLAGSNPTLNLCPHWNPAVWRILREYAVGLFHELGAGKSTVMAAAVMELRRLGLAKKVLIVVRERHPPAIRGGVPAVLPAAELAGSRRGRLQAGQAQRVHARIASGDLEAVIVALSQFTLLPVHPETEADFIRREATGYRGQLGELPDAARVRGDRSWRSPEGSSQKAIARF